MKRGGRLVGAAIALVWAVFPAGAQERRPAPPGSASIVFVLDSDRLRGELQVREATRPVMAWSTLIGPGTLRQFTVQPGTYRVMLEPNPDPLTVSAFVGRTAIVTLSGNPRGREHYADVRQSQAASAGEDSDVAAFLAANRVPQQAVEPVSLMHLGSGLTFVVRTD